MMTECWQYYPRYRPSFASLLETLQGDVKKTFFSVSWYYSERSDDASDLELDSLNMDDAHSETQPLHPSSINTSSSDQNIHTDHDSVNMDDDDHMGLSRELLDGKDLMMDLRPAVPTRMCKPNGGRYEMTNGLTNGHNTASDSGETEDECESLCASPLLANGSAITADGHSNCESHSRATSIVSGRAPPSYNTATLDQSIGPTDASIWASDTPSGSKGNSCNGSASGHIHYNNTLTSAC